MSEEHRCPGCECRLPDGVPYCGPSCEREAGVRIDAELEALGYDPKEVAVRGKVLIEALLSNQALRARVERMENALERIIKRTNGPSYTMAGVISKIATDALTPEKAKREGGVKS